MHRECEMYFDIPNLTSSYMDVSDLSRVTPPNPRPITEGFAKAYLITYIHVAHEPRGNATPSHHWLPANAAILEGGTSQPCPASLA